MPTYDRYLLEKCLGTKYLDATLSNFILPDNHLPNINSWVKKEKGLFFFSGNPGLGKSYFCAALCNWYNEKNLEWRYFKCNHFLSDVRSKIRQGWDYIEYMNDKFRDVKLFCLDDLGENTTETEWQNEIISHIIDLRYTSELPTVITSNKTILEMRDTYGERTLSRLSERGNLIISLNWKDKRSEEF